MEEVEVLGVDIVGLALQHQVRNVFQRACALHGSYTGGNLVEMVCLAQLVRRQLAHAVFPLSTQLRGPASPVAYPQRRRVPKHTVPIIEAVAEGGRRQARRGAHSKVGGLVNRLADLDKVVEDGGVNGVRARGEVVAMSERLEDLRGKLEPGTVERRDVAPMPIVPLLGYCLSASRRQYPPKLTCCDR